MKKEKIFGYKNYIATEVFYVFAKTSLQLQGESVVVDLSTMEPVICYVLPIFDSLKIKVCSYIL